MQVQNEKWPLTINRENIAKEKSKISEFRKFDQVFSSNYVRAICTAKYFTNGNVYIDESFGERQFEDFNYKIGNGECLNEVLLREEKALTNILNNYNGKKILIVGHSTGFII